MIGRGLVLAALVLVCWPVPVAAAAPATTAGVGRQADAATTDLLEVTSVSPWVAADGDFQVRFAPSAAVPLDATFSYTVHQRLQPQGPGSLRSTLERLLDGGTLGGILQSTVSAPVITLGNPAGGLVLDIPIRSSRDPGGSDRALLPTAGIHPVELRLDDAAGDELWSTVVFLNRLPDGQVTDRDGDPARMSVTLAVPVDGAPTLSPDGHVVMDATTRAAVDGATALLTQVPDAPLVLALRPNVLSAVTRSPDAGERRFLQALGSPGSAAVVGRLPYVAVDTGGLVAAGADDELVRQVALGTSVVRDTTGRQPAVSTWYLDDTVSPESLELIRNLGATRIVVSPDRLRSGSNDAADAARTTAVGVQGAPGITASAFDAQLSFRLTADTPAPAQRANQIVTELMSTWFDAADRPRTSFPGPSSVILVPPTTDPEVLRSLVPALTSDGPLSTSPSDVPDRPGVRDGRTLIAALSPRTPVEQRGPVASVRASRRLIDGYESMAPTAAADLSEWRLLNEETLARDMPGQERTAIHARIASEVDARTRAVQLPRSRRVLLTSRNATIPLRFRNDLPVDVHLLLRTRSLRLEIGGGETREIVLKPGENRIDLPVVVRASGGSLLRIDVRSPDGSITLPSVDVPVTSSTISGVGAALSVISLLFLAGWWIRTARRRRRHDAGAGGEHPGTAEPGPREEPGDDEPTPASVGPPSRPRTGTADSVGPGG